jgi:hypothetical protein
VRRALNRETRKQNHTETEIREAFPDFPADDLIRKRGEKRKSTEKESI